jgi:alanyl-tRNA synthetase
VPSSPVIPFDDPTILFTNAGMNQFKDVFTGKRKPDYPRATSVQKCIRAGGKHNDLDNVGFTARHHTFFEMLGNWSFGDYFQEEAIVYAWEWVTKELKLPVDRLSVTVYENDDAAFRLWEKIAPALKHGRILRFGKHDNYWSMGDVGPCGPCSEIHFDRGEKYGTGPEDVVNGKSDRHVEIWNLVFMQFDQTPDGQLVNLPKPSVDTGAGLERIAAIMQQCDTNYGIDLFQNLIAAVSDLTGAKYADNKTSHNVVVDHVRALTFALTDGAGISNEGRGYVLRRILRRAARHGRELGAHEPFIYRLVPVLVDEMGDAYPELREKRAHVENVIRAEEESFLRTLDTGLDLFGKIATRLKKTGSSMVPGDEVFKLYDTYGFPYDLTEIIATEQKLTLDRPGFEAAMTAQQERSRATAGFGAEQNNQKILEALSSQGLDSCPETRFLRQSLQADATLQKCVCDDPSAVAVVVSQTPMYAESGGQTGDTGWIRGGNFQIDVASLVVLHGHYVHLGRLTQGQSASVKPGEAVTVEVDADRRWDIMRNHTATHLAHAALRKVLGDHVRQSGSYVGPDRLRFDFSHHQPLTPEEITEMERLVNEQILRGSDVNTEEMSVDKAKASGAMALFGEKYGDLVRVVSVADFSKELCGGTHVQNVSQIGPFFVTLETGVASGVRRMEAVTGREAQKYMLWAKGTLARAGQLLGRPEADILTGLEQLRDSASAAQKEIKKLKTEMVSGKGASIGREVKIGSISLWINDFGDADRDTIGAWIDRHQSSDDPRVAMAWGRIDEKPTLFSGSSAAFNTSTNISLGKFLGELLKEFGGRGGGKQNFAQGGVPDDGNTTAEKVFERAENKLREKVG